jgi:F-box domain
VCPSELRQSDCAKIIECLKHVADFFDADTLVACALTSRMWYQIIMYHSNDAWHRTLWLRFGRSWHRKSSLFSQRVASYYRIYQLLRVAMLSHKQEAMANNVCPSLHVHMNQVAVGDMDQRQIWRTTRPVQIVPDLTTRIRVPGKEVWAGGHSLTRSIVHLSLYNSSNCDVLQVEVVSSQPTVVHASTQLVVLQPLQSTRLTLSVRPKGAGVLQAAEQRRGYFVTLRVALNSSPNAAYTRELKWIQRYELSAMSHARFNDWWNEIAQKDIVLASPEEYLLLSMQSKMKPDLLRAMRNRLYQAAGAVEMNAIHRHAAETKSRRPAKANQQPQSIVWSAQAVFFESLSKLHDKNVAKAWFKTCSYLDDLSLVYVMSTSKHMRHILQNVPGLWVTRYLQRFKHLPVCTTAGQLVLESPSKPYISYRTAMFNSQDHSLHMIQYGLFKRHGDMLWTSQDIHSPLHETEPTMVLPMYSMDNNSNSSSNSDNEQESELEDADTQEYDHRRSVLPTSRLVSQYRLFNSSPSKPVFYRFESLFPGNVIPSHMSTKRLAPLSFQYDSVVVAARQIAVCDGRGVLMIHYGDRPTQLIHSRVCTLHSM